MRYFCKLCDYMSENGDIIEKTNCGLRCPSCRKIGCLLSEGSIDPAKHPLLNPESRHYEMIDGIEAINMMEGVMTKEELMGYAKGCYLKYQLRLGAKDEVEKELGKMKGYKAYFEYLKGSLDG